MVPALKSRVSTTINRATALMIGLLVASTQAYGPTAPIQWRNRVVMPKISARPFKDSAAEQLLLIRDPPNRMYRDNVPYFTLNSDNSITLEGTDSCIEATSVKSGNAIHLNRCTGNPAQKWNWIPDNHGGSHIQLKNTNQCLDASFEGGVNGAPIVLWECDSKGAEAWKFEELAPLAKQGQYVMLSLVTVAAVAALSLGALLWQYTGPHKPASLPGDGTSNLDEGGISLSSQLAIKTTASPSKASHRRGSVFMNAGSGFGGDGDARHAWLSIFGPKVEEQFDSSKFVTDTCDDGNETVTELNADGSEIVTQHKVDGSKTVMGGKTVKNFDASSEETTMNLDAGCGAISAQTGLDGSRTEIAVGPDGSKTVTQYSVDGSKMVTVHVVEGSMTATYSDAGGATTLTTTDASGAAAFHHHTRPLLQVLNRRAQPVASAASFNLEELSSALPFLDDPNLLSHDVSYNGLGVSISGRAAYSDAASRWRATLPLRLHKFEFTDKVVYPPDQRGMISYRYQLSFEAPVPPAVLPGQRQRLNAARLQRTTEGRTRVTARIVGTIQLDADRDLVRRHTEQLVGDPMAVATSIAHFELLNARAVSLSPVSGLPPPVREPLAYWNALRGMMRIELEEIRRRERAQSDELSVLTDDCELSDADFEQAFRWYIARIILSSVAGPLAIFGIAKLLRAGLDAL